MTHPAYGTLRQVTPNAAVLLAPNPNVMTLDGTNTWLLRAPGTAECVVVDPGPLDEDHLAKVAAHGPVSQVIITHHHGDHTDGAARFAELTGAPTHAVTPAHRHNGGGDLVDGQLIEAAGLRLRIWATPATPPTRSACSSRTTAPCSPATPSWAGAPPSWRTRTASSARTWTPCAA